MRLYDDVWCLLFLFLLVGSDPKKRFLGDVSCCPFSCRVSLDHHVSPVQWDNPLDGDFQSEVLGVRDCVLPSPCETKIRPKSIRGLRCRAAKDGRSAAGAEGKKQRDVTCKNRNIWRPPDVTNLWVKGFRFLIGHPSWRLEHVLGLKNSDPRHFGTLPYPSLFFSFSCMVFLCYQCSDNLLWLLAISFPGGSRSRFGICYALCGGGFWQEIRVLSGKPGLQVAGGYGVRWCCWLQA